MSKQYKIDAEAKDNALNYLAKMFLVGEAISRVSCCSDRGKCNTCTYKERCIDALGNVSMQEIVEIPTAIDAISTLFNKMSMVHAAIAEKGINQYEEKK